MKLTKLNFRLPVIAKLIVIAVFHSTTAYAANLIPTANSGLYYQIGGGDDVPMPAFYDTTYVPLEAASDVGLGFDCGAFNPTASIRNSLNEIKGSALDVERQVLQDATGAVTEFPLYELSRADPNLYNLITTAMASAREDMAVSTKSCETMQNEIGGGGDPYSDWGQLSLGDRWKKEIGVAEVSGNGDINQAQTDVSADAGKSGVPWVDPNSYNGNQTVYAGGKNQRPIRVIHDTVSSGYNTIINDSSSNNNYLFSSAPKSEMTKLFPTANAAANWISDTIGDETITTYNNGEKSSQPGVGLYTDIQTETGRIQPKLQALANGTEPLSVKNLQAVSTEGMALSPEIITDIQNQPAVIQTIMVEKLAQNIAAMKIINKAQLAVQILQTGSQIPAIYSNKAAQQTIQAGISQLQQQTQNVLMFVKARQTLMSNMLATVVQANSAQQARNTAIAVPSVNVPVMQQGAVSDSNQ